MRQSWIDQQINREIQNVARYGEDQYVAAFGRRVLRENKAAVCVAATNYFAQKGSNLHPIDIYGLADALNAVSHARHFRYYTLIGDFNERVAQWVLNHA